MNRLVHRTLLALSLGLAVAPLAACGPKCEPPGQQCPVAPPTVTKIDIGALLGGFENGGSGSGSVAVPGLGSPTVKITCEAVTIKKDTPKAGTTQAKTKCSFSKLGISGDVDLTIEIDGDGKGSVTATGSASVPFLGAQNINITAQLGGGNQAGQTATVLVTVNGLCSLGSLERNGDKIIISLGNPEVKIEISK